MSDGPKVIWLQPTCKKASAKDCDFEDAASESGCWGDDRMWCEDCVWDTCPVCGAAPIKYEKATQ